MPALLFFRDLSFLWISVCTTGLPLSRGSVFLTDFATISPLCSDNSHSSPVDELLSTVPSSSVTISNGSQETLEIRPPVLKRSKSSKVIQTPSTFPIHLHFGAGKLGLGLVVPALEQSDTRYVIVQRPSKDWESIVDSGCSSVPLMVNDKEAVSRGLTVITDRLIREAAERGESVLDLISKSPKGQGHLLLTSDQEICKMLAIGSSSFSCALGGAISKVLVPLLSELPPRFKSARPTLYACENDLGSVESLAAELKSSVNVLPCMVDRICSSRDIIPGPSPVIRVQAEDHTGSIVLLDSTSSDQDDLPLDGDTVMVPETDEVADYLFIQKKRLVNSMHTVLAFSTLVEYDKNNTALFQWEEALPNLPLLNYETASPEVKDMIWSWAVAQILVLMKEQGVDVMTEAHGAETEDELVEQLLGVARQTLERFSSIEDTTTRVLGGGVSNRFNERLVPVQEGMHLVHALLSDIPVDCAQRKVLTAANVDIDTVLAACDQLVEDARKFAELDEDQMAAESMWTEMTGGISRSMNGVLKAIPSVFQVSASVIGGGLSVLINNNLDAPGI
mmetsp:Transcript_9279/g.26542  ORF Transcript_9279/g.26542 Transcript_9279/m.26542 type:complete len:563 (-) Transcript_9279:158-1846(-)